MQADSEIVVIQQKEVMATALEATVRIGILVLLVAWCFSIVRPFFIPIAWGVIIAVSAHSGYVKLGTGPAGAADSRRPCSSSSGWSCSWCPR
jgi:hypothetical protein